MDISGSSTTKPSSPSDDLPPVHVDDRCEHGQRRAVDSVDDQRLGFSHVQNGRRGDQADADRPGGHDDAESAALTKVVREGPPVAQHVQKDGRGERDPAKLMRELEGPLRNEEHGQTGGCHEDARANRHRRGPGSGIPRLHHWLRLRLACARSL